MGTNSSPEFPWPGGTPGAEPPDPVAGKPGHFSWSRWVKQFVKNLNTNLMAHQDAADPHPQYLMGADHLGAPDPHPQYTTTAEAQALVNTHAAAADPHPVYMTAAEVTALIDAHLVAADPHPVYLTKAEADVLYAPKVI